MKFNILPTILISLFSLTLTVSFLINNEDTWISVIFLSVLCIALTVLVVYKNAALLTFSFIVLNHLAFSDGITVSRFLIPAIAVLLSPLLVLEFKPQNFKPALLSVVLVLIYYTVIFLVKPFQINLGWVFLHLESLLLFVFVQLFKWDLNKIMQVVNLHLIFLLIFGVAEYFFSYRERIRGPMQSATAYGVLLVVIWSIWISYNIFRAKRNTLLLLVISLLTFIVILWTGTRMALLGIILTFFCISVILILNSRYSPLVKVFFLTSVPFFLFIFFLLIWNLIPDNLTIKKSFQYLLSGKIDPSNTGRIIAWISALKAFNANPLFGIGNGNFLQFHENFLSSYGFNLEILGIGLVTHAHNLYLIILSENGLFGFSIILYIFISALCNYARYLKNSTSKDGYCLLVGLLVLCTLCFFDAIPFFPPTQAWGAWFLSSLLQISFQKSDYSLPGSTGTIKNLMPEIQSAEEIL